MTARPLASVDWDFVESKAEPDVHPYPCRFISEIPGTAIDLLNMQGPVIDPFCGSGTSLVEAVRRGRDAIGVDLNPIACLISRVKTTQWRAGDELVAGQHVQSMAAWAARGDDCGGTQLRDEIPRLEHWFEPLAQEVLSGAIAYVRSLDPGDPWRDRCALAFSAAVVRLSRQDSDTRYAAVEKSLNKEQALTILSGSLQRVTTWLQYWQPRSPDATVSVACADARTLDWIPDSSIGGAIFSPPYPNAYEYWLYHKYRMYWLGFDPLPVRASEIGARPHYSKPNGLTEGDFAQQMLEVFNELDRVLRPEAPVLVIVGDSIIRGKFVDNGRLLSHVGESAGLRLIESVTRQIRRSSFNQAHSTARDSEHVLLFEASS